MKSMQKGFTLIELMIVVAIIAILAAIAIPQYQTYVIRSQVTRVMGEAGDQKVVVEDCLNNNLLTVGTASGDCISTASSSDLLGTATPGVATTPQITSPLVAGAGNTIVATFGDHANTNLTGKTLTWTRTGSGSWSCATTVSAKYAPTSCPGS
jgi:type IV pilus assembly protein PilA